MTPDQVREQGEQQMWLAEHNGDGWQAQFRSMQSNNMRLARVEVYDVDGDILLLYTVGGETFVFAELDEDP